LEDWAYRRGVLLDFIRPGKPIESAFIEFFNSTDRPPSRSKTAGRRPARHAQSPCSTARSARWAPAPAPSATPCVCAAAPACAPPRRRRGRAGSPTVTRRLSGSRGPPTLFLGRIVRKEHLAPSLQAVVVVRSTIEFAAFPAPGIPDVHREN